MNDEKAVYVVNQVSEAAPPLRRRLFVLRMATLGGAGAAVAACVPNQQPVFYAPPQQVRRGTGLSDSDPSDAPGQGRGGQRGSGVSDSDPNDAPGFGRGGQRVSGVSDSDPNDAPGRGRGGYGGTVRRGLTDSDPSDGPGRGRRGY